jgi:hypothetical protein
MRTDDEEARPLVFRGRDQPVDRMTDVDEPEFDAIRVGAAVGQPLETLGEGIDPRLRGAGRATTCT